MANKSRDTANLVSNVGISTFRTEVDFTNGPVQIGSATSTGTASQPLQVTGGAYVSGNLGIGTTNPNSRLDVFGNTNVSGLTSTRTIKVGTAGTALQIYENGVVAIGTDASLAPSDLGLFYVDSNKSNKVPISITHSSENYTKNMGSSARTSATYLPPGVAIDLFTNFSLSIRSSNLINFNAYNATRATGIYLGAHAGTISNGPADFVIGRRTGVTSWEESFRITHSNSATQQFLGFGTQNVPTNDPIYIAGSIHQRPYGIANTRTGLTTSFDDSNNYKMKLLTTTTSSSGIAGISTAQTFGKSADEFDYVRRHFNTISTTATTAFNQNICEIDFSGGNFIQIGIYIVWGTRIQAVSDSTTQANQRLYGVNKFNTFTGAFTIGSYLANVNASSSTHMDIEVVDKGSGVLAIQYQQSATVQEASFIGGYIEIFNVGSSPFSNTLSGIVKWNI